MNNNVNDNIVIDMILLSLTLSIEFIIKRQLEDTVF